MQSDWKEVYKITSKRTGKDEQQYKDLGNFVFASLANHLRKPMSLITKLKGVGSWYLRKNRIKTIVDLYPPDFEKTEEEFQSNYGFLKNENKKEIYRIFSDRLADYNRYIEKKESIKKIRYVHKPIPRANDISEE